MVMSMVNFYDTRVLRYNLMLFSDKVTKKFVIQTQKPIDSPLAKQNFIIQCRIQNPKF
jgi:hypothetical protein